MRLSHAIVHVALALTVVPAAACTHLTMLAQDGLRQRLCIKGSTNLSEALSILGGAGNVDPEVTFVLRLLNAMEERMQVRITPSQQSRLIEILKENDNLRDGLRTIILKATFNERQLRAWCDWKAAGMPAGKHNTEIDVVEEAATCGPS